MADNLKINWNTSVKISMEYNNVKDFIEKIHDDAMRIANSEVTIVYENIVGKSKNDYIVESPEQYMNKNWMIQTYSRIHNPMNMINCRIVKCKNNVKYNFRTITSGLTSFDEFANVLQFIKDNRLDVESEDEGWLNEELIDNLLLLKDRLMSSRIRWGMDKNDETFGRPTDVSAMEKARQMYESGNYTVTDIANKVGKDRATIYRWLKKWGIK